MLINEAIALASIIDNLNPSRILDCGSGTRIDRTIVQPHIAAVFDGYSVTFTDLVGSRGNVQCDFMDAESVKKLPRCELTTCFSMLEHVKDITTALKNVVEATEKYLLVSVPMAYPLHNCPFDNGWRPDGKRLAARLADHGLTIEAVCESQPEKFNEVIGAQSAIVLAKR